MIGISLLKVRSGHVNNYEYFLFTLSLSDNVNAFRECIEFLFKKKIYWTQNVRSFCIQRYIVLCKMCKERKKTDKIN